MHILIPLFAIFATYAFSSDALFLALRRFLSQEPPPSPRLFLLTRGLGPVVVAATLYPLLIVAPRRSDLFYVLFVLFFFTLLALYGLPQFPALLSAYSTAFRAMREVYRELSRSRMASIVALALILMLLFLSVIAIVYPIVEHDTLTAAIEARIIHRDGDLTNFLAVRVPDPATGYHALNFRIPFLQLEFVWFSFFSGGDDDVLARTLSPIFAVHCLLLLACVLTRREGEFHRSLWAVFLLLTTPLFAFLTYSNALDPVRIYLTLLVLVWVAEWIESAPRSSRLGAVVGVIGGLALFCHLLEVAAVLAGMGGYALIARTPIKRKVFAVTLVALISFAVGAQYHYFFNPVVRGEVDRSLKIPALNYATQALTSATSKVATKSARSISSTGDQQTPKEKVKKPSSKRKASRPGLLQRRGQGGNAVSQFIFGRLQPFSRFEHFGFVFYALVWGLVLSIRRRTSMTVLDILLLATLVVSLVMVMSGFRHLSWSNPRYFATGVLVAAYFGSCALLAIWPPSRQPTRWRRWATALLLALMAGPFFLVSSIRGTKVGITNTGSFYQDFRSFRWVEATIDDPSAAFRSFAANYLGIASTLRYLFSDESTKLKHSHDYFAGVLYFNETDLPEETKVFVLRDARYFYYSRFPGRVWYHPEIAYGYRRLDPCGTHQYLRERGITHVLVDTYSEMLPGYVGTRLGEMLANPDFAELVFEYGSARVYRLTRLVPEGSSTCRGES